MSDQIVLPVVTATEVGAQPIHRLVISDFIRQVDENLTAQESNIKKFGEQLENLQKMRISSLAHRQLLNELVKKLDELESPAKG
jgi:hypothetical protein